MVTPRNALAFAIIDRKIQSKDDFSIDVVYSFIQITYFTADINNATNS